MTTLPRALAPLRHPRYRRLAGSLALSLLSQGMWAVAVVWQVVALGGGPAGLSLVVAVSAGAMLASTLLGGALADRIPQRYILLGEALTQAVTPGRDRRTVPRGHARPLASGGRRAHRRRGDGLLLPGILGPGARAAAPGELLAANGFEGVVRPMLAQAAGPAVAGFLVASISPGAALTAAALSALAAAGCLAGLPVTPVRREPGDDSGTSVLGLLADVREGFRYMVRTPWLLATLLFASMMLLAFIGPFEVLMPFAIKAAGGGPNQHAFVLAAFGIGGAVGSLVVASLRLPRRYLTVMNLLWGLGCIPLVIFGFTTQLWLMLAAGALMGATFQAGMVIWGTLLQRRVPAALLGRISSLDFFVSLSFMPVSMALAGPVSELIGLTATFLIGGLLPPVLAVLAIVAARLPADEMAHPLDVPAEPAQSACRPGNRDEARLDPV